MIEIKLDTQRLMAAFSTLQQAAWPYAARQSVNRTAAAVQSAAVRQVAKGAGLPAKDTRPAFRRTRATLREAVAIVSATGRPIALIHFSATQARKGVSAKAWGKRKLYKGTFIATMRSGKRGVWVRTGKGRTPIKQLWGPSIPSVMADKAIADSLQRLGSARLAKELEANMRYYTEKTLARAGK